MEMRRIAHDEATKVVTEVVEPIATALWGPKNSRLQGGRDVDQGIAQKVDDMYQQSHNGGLPAKITAASFDRRTKIQVAVISGGFSVVLFVAGAIIS